MILSRSLFALALVTIQAPSSFGSVGGKYIDIGYVQNAELKYGQPVDVVLRGRTYGKRQQRKLSKAQVTWVAKQALPDGLELKSDGTNVAHLEGTPRFQGKWCSHIEASAKKFFGGKTICLNGVASDTISHPKIDLDGIIGITTGEEFAYGIPVAPGSHKLSQLEIIGEIPQGLYVELNTEFNAIVISGNLVQGTHKLNVKVTNEGGLSTAMQMNFNSQLANQPDPQPIPDPEPFPDPVPDPFPEPDPDDDIFPLPRPPIHIPPPPRPDPSPGLPPQPRPDDGDWHRPPPPNDPEPWRPSPDPDPSPWRPSPPDDDDSGPSLPPQPRPDDGDFHRPPPPDSGGGGRPPRP